MVNSSSRRQIFVIDKRKMKHLKWELELPRGKKKKHIYFMLVFFKVNSF